MNNNVFKVVVLTLGATALMATSLVRAQEATTLDELLGFVKQGQVTEALENKKREAEFKSAEADQARKLQEAKAERARQERISLRLEKRFEKNELLIADKQ